MDKIEKELLLKDLCARLPYRPKGVKLNIPFDPKDITIVGYTGRFVETVDDEIEVERVRLYLRPMSSMTEEEKEEYDKTFDWDYSIQGTPFNWLLSHHFDFRNLIAKGLALEAPKDVYKTE